MVLISATGWQRELVTTKKGQQAKKEYIKKEPKGKYKERMKERK
jgi:hypothetical protein